MCCFRLWLRVVEFVVSVVCFRFRLLASLCWFSLVVFYLLYILLSGCVLLLLVDLTLLLVLCVLFVGLGWSVF